MRSRTMLSMWAILLSTWIALAAPAAASVSFVDVAQSIGLTETDTTYGASWADINGDGRPDLWLGNHNKPPVLYLNDPVLGFTPYTNIVGLTNEDIHGAAFADFDNDGDQDLLITVGAEIGAGQGPNLFLVNNNGQYVESAATYNVEFGFARARHVTWFDWNNDSYLDFMLVSDNERDLPPEAPTRVFTWNPTTNQFDEEPWVLHDKRTTTHAQLLLANPVLPGTTPAISLNHNKNGFPDFIYSYDNLGLTDVTSAFAFPTIDGVRDMAVADFDNDLTSDLFTVSQGEGRLLLQQPSGLVDDTNAAGISFNRGLFTVAADFDNDKDIDIYVARSNVGTDVNLANHYYRNNGDGTYTEDTGTTGTSGTLTGLVSGITTADYNDDGFVDILVTNSDNWFLPATTAPIHLFENQGNSNNWLHVNLVGTLSNRDAIGARVYVTSGGTTQLRELNNGIHHRTQNHKRLHFGLATDTVVTLLEVHWPNGDIQSFTNLSPNQHLTVYQSDPATSNQAPIATFTATQQPNELTVGFDSTGSHDPDGIITSYLWDFGDGNTSTAQHPSHDYMAPGTYSVTLTVTDDMAATAVQASNLLLELEVAVEAAGSSQGSVDNVLDEELNGSLNLDTAWTSDNVLANAWITLDLGVSTDVVQILLAARGDLDYNVDIYVGDTLTGAGKVSGAPVASCTTPGGGNQLPQVAFPCNVPLTTGRYVTVQSTNRVNFKVYGLRAVAGSLNNQLPLGSFSATPQPGTLDLVLDALMSSDPDGTILHYGWDFGDGVTTSDATALHTYASAGSYPVTLTLIDNGGGTSTLSATVTIATTVPTLLPTTVTDVGGSTSTQNNLNDTLAGGGQNLSTKWENANGVIADAWFTVDVGMTDNIGSVNLAPRGDRQYQLEIRIGNSLNGAGQVTGGSATNCTIPSGAAEVPAALTACPINDHSGRYITVSSQNRNKLPMYGIEVVRTAPAPGSNVAPNASFSVLQQPFTLDVDFDAAASSDSDGVITQYVWDFGEGNSATGPTPTHTYSNDASYTVSLAVTDDDDAVHVTTQVIDLLPLPDAPVFTLQPQSQTVEVGDPVTFTVALAGTPPITLQWRANGVDIPGATGMSYTSLNHTIGDNGTIINVIATNNAATQTSNSAVLTVIPANLHPAASFTLDVNGGIVPLTVNADASSSQDSDGTIVSYQWDFGDGTTATGVSATHTYVNDATYTVTLTVIDDDGDSGTTTQTVDAQPPISPSVVTHPAPQTVLLGTAATFTVNAVGTAPLAYQWRRNGVDIVGATGSSLTLSSASAADNGALYSVFISNPGGDVTSNAAQLTVNTPPTPAFSVTPANAPIPFDAVVDATASTDIDGNIVSYDWTFGDGGTGSGATTTHNYATGGTFTITLTVTDDLGATATTTQTVTANIAPIASFTVDNNVGLAPHTVLANASSSSDADGSIVSYAWDFGDGATGTGPTPSHTYAAGTYTLTLTVTDNDGATHTSAQNIIANLAPTAAFTQSSTNGLLPLAVSFDASSSSDPDDSIANYAWDFGDGGLASGAAVSHTYTAVGEYTVTLTVTDTRGATATATSTVVANVAPVAQFTTSTVNALVPVALTVDASGSSDSNGTIDLYQWDFGDGTTATGSSAAHTYSTAGIYVITLTVTDNHGASSSASTSVIANLPPIASFTFSPGSGVEPLPVSFDGSPSSDPNGSIVSYAWNFGDGGTATGSNPNHTFAVDGSYPVTLTVTDNDGATNTSTVTLVVDPLLPPSILAQPQSQPVPLGGDVTFDVVVAGTPPFAYQWLRDGTPIAGANQPSYTLTNAALTDDGAAYQVRISNAATTVSSADAIVSVVIPPVITADPQPLTVAVGTSASFSITATGTQPLSYQWQRNGVDIAGATASSYTLPSAALLDNGAQIGARASNLAGDAFSNTALLTVFIPNDPPSANFAISQPANDLMYDFDGSLSSDPDGTVQSYAWDFGDGTTASGAQVSHTFAAEDSYTITLTVTDNLGAVNSTQQTLSATAFTIVRGTGSHASQQVPERLIDTVNGAQDFSTSWQDDGSTDASWFTLDLGTTRTVLELLIGPRADKNNKLDIFVGDTLSGGRVDNAILAQCNPPNFGFTVPVELQSCPLPTTLGRFVTVSARTPAVFRVYGVEVVTQNGPVNQVPIASFQHTVLPDSREVDFDASASGDTDGTIVSWDWDLGDGSSASGETLNYTYTSNGIYTATLTVTDDAGATATSTVDITIDLSVAIAKATTIVHAVGNNTANSGNINDELPDTTQRLTSVWDNNSSNLNTAWFTLDLGAQQNVVRLRIAPKGNRSYNLRVDAGNVLSNDQVSGGATTNCVTPGTDSATPTVLHTCEITGLSGRYVTITSLNRANYRVFGVEVWVEDGGSNSPPLSMFSATQVTDTLDVDFDGSASTDVDGSITAWDWDFGDGNTGTGATVSHTYAAAGNYTVTLQVTDDEAATASSNQLLTVLPPPVAPTITSEPQDVTVTAPAGASFSVQATGTAPLSYQWQRDGVPIGGATASTYGLGSTSAADDGALFTVTVSNAIGSVASAAALLTVEQPNTLPTADFTIDITSGDAPLTVTVDGGPSTDSDGVITGYDWAFGDGGIATGATQSHTYTTAGNFVLELTVTDDRGATASASVTVTVTAPAVPPSITAQPQPITVTEPASATFSVTATGTPALSYQWLRDGLPISAATAASYTLPATALSDDGALFSVTVTNANGSATSNTALLTVTSAPNPPPVAAFTATAQADPLEVVFDASSSTDDGSIASYNFTFGDGGSSSGALVTHTYAAAGDYLVTLTVTDNLGSSASTSQTVTVTTAGPPQLAAATVADVGARAFRQADLLDTNGDGSQDLSSFWNSGGSGIANAWFTLDLQNSSAVADVRIAPRADKLHNLEISVGDVLVNGQVSSAPAAQCSVPDLGSVIVPTALHTCVVGTASGRFITVRSLNQANFRVYGVEVYVGGSGGGGPTNAPPSASVVATPVANSLTADFDASGSTDSDGTIVQYVWDFGDGTATQSTAGPTISYTYAVAGTFAVTVTVTDDTGDTDDATTMVTVVGSSSGGPTKQVLAIVAAGRNFATTPSAIDETGSGDQNLDTFWTNGGTGTATAWVTVDLGSSLSVTEVHVAPRGNRAHNFDLTIGDTLVDGQVAPPVTDICSLPGNGSTKPSSLFVCTVPATTGRYVTIKSRNFSNLRLYGIEVWAQ